MPIHNPWQSRVEFIVIIAFSYKVRVALASDLAKCCGLRSFCEAIFAPIAHRVFDFRSPYDHTHSTLPLDSGVRGKHASAREYERAQCASAFQ